MTRRSGHHRRRIVAAGLFVGLFVGAFAALAACSSSSVDLQGGPLNVELTVTPNSLAAGGEVVIEASSIGTQLLGTVIDYGDGGADSIPASGAQTQTVTRPRIYPDTGTFTVRATVEDFSQGTTFSEAVITVN